MWKHNLTVEVLILELLFSFEDAKELYEKYGDNEIPSPNKDCPKFLCCLLPCLDRTSAMIAYKQCITGKNLLDM